MPSTRKSRQAASLPYPSPKRSAARSAYDVPEIRSAILRCLRPADLATMMRVERQGIALVAGELYRTMGYERVRYKMSLSTARRRLYCESVREIHVISANITSAVCRELGIAELPAEEYRTRTKGYQPDLFLLLVRVLRKKCSGLRRITYDWGEDGLSGPQDSWVVNLHPNGGGHIDVLYQYEFSIASPPPTTFQKSLPPSPEYTLSSRFNLTLKGRDPLPEASAAWLTALRDDPRYADLHDTLSVDGLPIRLEDLSSLYARQDEAGHRVRLARIRAPWVETFLAPDFHSFAMIAGSSLTSLSLASESHHDFRESRGRITFADLPALTSATRTHLPNLSTLLIAINGIKEADAVCGAFLRDNLLREGGTLSQLRIITSGHTTSLLNVIRCLSPICRADAEVIIHLDGDKDWNGVWSAMSQTAYLAYLRAQSPERQAHLATVDFATLGITQPSQVLQLEYHPDGRPRGLRSTPSDEWSGYTKIDRAIAATNIRIHPIDHGFLLKCMKAARQLRQESADLPLEELFERCDRMLDCIKHHRRPHSPQAVLVPFAMEYDVRQYIGNLRDLASIASWGPGY